MNALVCMCFFLQWYVSKYARSCVRVYIYLCVFLWVNIRNSICIPNVWECRRCFITSLSKVLRKWALNWGNENKWKLRGQSSFIQTQIMQRWCDTLNIHIQSINKENIDFYFQMTEQLYSVFTCFSQYFNVNKYLMV